MAKDSHSQPDGTAAQVEPVAHQAVSEQELKLREQDRAEYEDARHRKAPAPGAREAALRELQYALVRNSAVAGF
jgi:hypothetical protein